MIYERTVFRPKQQLQTVKPFNNVRSVQVITRMLTFPRSINTM